MKSLKTIDGHTFDESLLTLGGVALDVGARGFGFTEYMARLGLTVIAMEPDRTVRHDGPGRFINAALVGNQVTEWEMYAGWSDGTGNQLCSKRPEHAEEFYPVACMTLESLMSRHCVPRFDIVKLDCEGSEYDILWNWPRHAAVQISVEFHDFLGMRPRKSYYEELFAGPLADYEIVQHEWRSLSPENRVMNYWDSLLILRPEFR